MWGHAWEIVKSRVKTKIILPSYPVLSILSALLYRCLGEIHPMPTPVRKSVLTPSSLPVSFCRISSAPINLWKLSHFVLHPTPCSSIRSKKLNSSQNYKPFRYLTFRYHQGTETGGFEHFIKWVRARRVSKLDSSVQQYLKKRFSRF